MEQIDKATVIYIKRPKTVPHELSFNNGDGESVDVEIVIENLVDFSLDTIERLIEKHQPSLVFIDSDDFDEVYEVPVGTFKDLGVDIQFSDETTIPTWDFDLEDY